MPSGGGAGACVVDGESSEVVVSGEGMTRMLCYADRSTATARRIRPWKKHLT